MSKRKRSSAAAASSLPAEPSPAALPQKTAPARRPRASRGPTAPATNPNANPEILDGLSALRASPDGHESLAVPSTTSQQHGASPVPSQSECNTTKATASAPTLPPTSLSTNRRAGKNKRNQGSAQHVKVDNADANNSPINAASQHATRPTGDAVVDNVGVTADPEDENALINGKREGEGEGEGEEDEARVALSRPPPVNSDYLPLPWKGRLGYACLNTYLRNANPPVFSSRTCRIASILEHRHPLKDPSQPEHATKNRPDKDQPADVARGQSYVQELGLANARDIIKMVRWNDKYGIRFMRLSSEMFPFASHEEYGYKLEPFAAETLAEAGKVIAELGHRVTTHPGQFTQLGSPRTQVIDAAIRDLEFHDELLSLLKLPAQQDRDAVMILHLGGAFGDKPATLDRFRENYARLPQGIKNRLVLENDDVIWSVHDLLPLCQELNIPLVLDFHHHNIIFDSTKLREGTKDIMDLFPAILETWKRKGITPKMHYSEPCPEAITGRDRRKHSPRVMTLPPCPETMDLMIEAKDKEQAVFELMRTFKLPGFHTFNDMIPHVRQDENKAPKPKPKKAAKKGKKKKADDVDDMDMKIEEAEEEEKAPATVPEAELGMGGPEHRVYWPPGMEDWLRPPKRIVKKKEEGAATPATKKKGKTGSAMAPAVAATDEKASANGGEPGVSTNAVSTPVGKKAAKAAGGASSTNKKRATQPNKRKTKAAPTPSPSAEDDEEGDSDPLSDLGDDEEEVDDDGPPLAKKKRGAPARAVPARQRARRGAGRVSYKEEDADEMSE